MSWNYRVVKYVDISGDISYMIHEVYYDKDGKIDGWSADGISPYGSTLEELESCLMLMKDALEKEALTLDGTLIGNKDR